jgi:hypothetical protein
MPRRNCNTIDHRDGADRRLNINVDDFVVPLNNRLRNEGLPPVSAAELRAAVQSAVAMAVRQGRLDRAILVARAWHPGLHRCGALPRAIEYFRRGGVLRYDRLADHFLGRRARGAQI